MPTGDSEQGDISASDDEVLSQFGNEQAEDRIWAPEEEFILRDSIKTYRQTPKKEKARFVQKVVCRKIKEFMASQVREENLKKKGKNHREWLIKKKQIFNWMGNHARTERALKMPGLEQRFNFMKVVTEMKRAEILQEAKRLAAEAGRAKYIGFYQRARVNIRAQLTAEETKEYEELLRKWNAGTVPPEVQSRYVHKYSKRVLSEMNRRNFISMGMRSVIMECHIGIDNKLVYSLNDSNALNFDHPNVLSFSRHNPAAVAAMTIAYKKYVSYVRSVVDGTAPVVLTEVFEEKNLTYHPGRMPIVPDKLRNQNGRETSQMGQSVIRAFVNKHFFLAGRKATAAPYSYIGGNTSLFFKALHFLAGVPFKDPSGYTAMEVVKIFRHWRKRQSKGAIPFLFLTVRVGKEDMPADYPPTILDDIVPILGKKPPPWVKLTLTMKHVVESDDTTEDSSSDETDTTSNDQGPKPVANPHALIQGKVTPPDSLRGPPAAVNPLSAGRHATRGRPTPKRRLFGRHRNRKEIHHSSNEELTADDPPPGPGTTGEEPPPVPLAPLPGPSKSVSGDPPPGASTSRLKKPIPLASRTTRSMLALPKSMAPPDNQKGSSRKKRKRK